MLLQIVCCKFPDYWICLVDGMHVVLVECLVGTFLDVVPSELCPMVRE